VLFRSTSHSTKANPAARHPQRKSHPQTAQQHISLLTDDLRYNRERLPRHRTNAHPHTHRQDRWCHRNRRRHTRPIQRTQRKQVAMETQRKVYPKTDVRPNRRTRCCAPNVLLRTRTRQIPAPHPHLHH